LCALASDSTEKYTQDITEKGERTSIEFETHFSDILNHALGSDSKYKNVILVIDNLDRIDAKDALTIWSTLQTFLQSRNHPQSSEHWHEKVWIIVPYDRTGLKKLWAISNHNSSKSQLDDLTKESETTSEETDASQSFFDKCFQIWLDVPEPIYERWFIHLDESLIKVLPNLPVNQKDRIMNSFKKFYLKRTNMPTPREIKNFANQIGVLRLHWPTDVSPESLALYALYRRENTTDEVKIKLIKGDIPGKHMAGEKLNEIRDELADILFAQLGKGRQLLLEPEIKLALQNDDVTHIEDLINTHSVGFWPVWESCEDNLIGPGGSLIEDLASITITLNKIKNSFDQKHLDSVINQLKHRWKDKGPILLSDNNNTEGITTILDLAANDISFTKIMKNHIIGSIEFTFKDNEASPVAIDSDLVRNIDSIFSAINKTDNPINEIFVSNLTSDKWVKWCMAVDEHIPDILKAIKPNDSVLTELNNALPPQNPNQNNPSVDNSVMTALICAIIAVPNSGIWPDITNKLISYIQHSNGTPRGDIPDDTFNLLGHIYSRHDQARPNIDQMLNAGAF